MEGIGFLVGVLVLLVAYLDDPILVGINHEFLHVIAALDVGRHLHPYFSSCGVFVVGLRDCNPIQYLIDSIRER